MVERCLAKADIAGPNPVSRSRYRQTGKGLLFFYTLMHISDGDELFRAKRQRRKKGSELSCTEKGSGENAVMKNKNDYNNCNWRKCVV